MKRKAIIFDRDGTLIVDKIYLNDPKQVEYLPGVFEALRMLRDDGFVFCVATNQSGVPRGLVDVRNLDEIHRVIRADFARHGVDILSFHSAPYMTTNDHWFRKPNPGMLLEAVQWHNLDAKQSWMVGDRVTDVIAGHRAGMRTLLLRTTEEYKQVSSLGPKETQPDLISDHVLDACLEMMRPRP